MDKNQSLLQNVKRYYSRGAAQPNPSVVVESGKGAYVYDVNGQRYIDLLASASSANVGHCNPHVVQAIQKQAAKLIQYTPLYFTNAAEAELIPRLIKLAPISSPLKLSWGTSGANACDSIIRYARSYTHRPYIITFTDSCHGSTSISTSISGSLGQVKNLGPFNPGLVKIPYPNPKYRLKGETDDQFTQRMFKEFMIPFQTYVPADEAAVILIEPIQGDSGIVKAPIKYLQMVAKFAHQHGILLAVDEINQGLGRSGKWWSVQHFPGVEPDLLATGKSLASGMPLSAVIGRKSIMDSLVFPEDAFTTAGNPITAAASSATLDVIEDEDLVDRSRKLGPVAKEFFDQECDRYPFISHVRMYGLNGGIDIVDPKSGQDDSKLAEKIVNQIVKNHVLIATTNGNTLRFQPPLVIKQATLNRAFDLIDQAFKTINSKMK